MRKIVISFGKYVKLLMTTTLVVDVILGQTVLFSPEEFRRNLKSWLAGTLTLVHRNHCQHGPIAGCGVLCEAPSRHCPCPVLSN